MPSDLFQSSLIIYIVIGYVLFGHIGSSWISYKNLRRNWNNNMSSHYEIVL